MLGPAHRFGLSRPDNGWWSSRLLLVTFCDVIQSPVTSFLTGSAYTRIQYVTYIADFPVGVRQKKYLGYSTQNTQNTFRKYVCYTEAQESSSSVGAVTTLRAGRPRNRSSILGRGRRCYPCQAGGVTLVQNMQTNSGDHQTSYSVGTWDSFLVGTQPGREADHSP